MTVEEDGSTNYDFSDQNENFGSRQVYVHSKLGGTKIIQT